MSNKLEGEGSYEGTRRYDAGVRRKIEKGEVEAAAKKAKQALDGPEGKELREAEKRAKRSPKS